MQVVRGTYRLFPPGVAELLAEQRERLAESEPKRRRESVWNVPAFLKTESDMVGGKKEENELTVLNDE